MSFLLDTNICSAHLRRPARLTHRFIQYGGGLSTASIVAGELYAGAHMLGGPPKLLDAIADLLADINVLTYDHRCARVFGQLRGHLHHRGRVVGPLDLQIAAVALSNDLTLVTHNTKDFEHVPGLRLDDWIG